MTFQIDYQSSNIQRETHLTEIVPVHVMLDCGANVSFITESKCRFFGIDKFIQPAGQMALQADGKTQLQVKGELKMTLSRSTAKNEKLTFKFHALVVDKLNNCDVIGGQNFLIENHIDIYPKKRKIAVQEKYYFEETPSQTSGPLIPGSSLLIQKPVGFEISQETKYHPDYNPTKSYKSIPPNFFSLPASPSDSFESCQEESKPCIYNLKRIGVLWPGDKLTLELPDDIPSNSDVIVEPRIENKNNS